MQITMIDDEPEAMRYYITALTRKGAAVTAIDNADDACRYLQHAHPDLTALVLDIMMPPGKSLRGEDDHEGLRTGVILLQRILAHSSRFREKGNVLPVAILTNVEDLDTMQMLLELQISYVGKIPLRIWQKMDVAPMRFVNDFLDWMTQQQKTE